MSRPPFEVADIIRTAGDSFHEQYGGSLTWPQRKVLDAIVRCRTAALGGHRDQCASCGREAISYNSCRNRHCPKCQTGARDRWLAKRQQELLDVGYYHLVFSIPHELVPLMWQNKRQLFSLLFEASAAALIDVAADPKHLGAELGFVSILHTWGQTLAPHPHIHCVVPGGGLARTTRAGSLPVPASCYRSRCSAASFEASLSRDCDGSLLTANYASLVTASSLLKASASPVSCASFIGKTGSSMPSRLLAAPRTCCTIWLATPTAWPSPTTGCFPFLLPRSIFAGRTMPMAVNSAP